MYKLFHAHYLQKTTISNTLEQAKHGYQLDDLATKRDLKEMELKLQKEIAETKADLVRWVVGVGLLQITIIACAIVYMD